MDPENMMSDVNQYDEGTSSEASTGASGVLSTVKDKARDLGRNAVTAIDGKREPLANSLSSAANSLHSTGDSLHNTGDKASQLAQDAAEKASQLAHGAADKLQGSANYIRDTDLKDMMSSVEKYVKKNPAIALVAVGVIGFVAGRAMRND